MGGKDVTMTKPMDDRIPSPLTSVTPTPPTPRAPTKTPFYEATTAARYARQGLIREIEATTGARLICYIAEHHQQIDRHDVLGIVDLLHNIPVGSPIDLLLHSPGGDIDAAEKVISLIRKRAGTGIVRVVVPDFAKSAATLIALGSNTIVMSDTSELGAIDPQIELKDMYGNGSLHSAQSYLDAFETHSENLKADPRDPVASLMLSKMEPATVRKIERIALRSKAIAEDLLSKAMVKDEAKAKKIASELANTKRWHSHGQVIGHETATGLGLNVEYLPPESPLWIKFWRLYCLQIYTVDNGVKLFESSYASLPMA